MPNYDLCTTIVVGSASCVLYFFALLYRSRLHFYNSKVKKGLPMPPWDPVFGHLLVMNGLTKKYNLPPDLQMPDTLWPLTKTYGKNSDSLFYLDLWPFSGPMMLVSSPQYAIQACQQADFAVDRPDILLWSMHAITGGPSIFATNGTAWKDARNELQAGFSPSNVLSQTAYVLDEAEILSEILQKKALRQEVFQLDPVLLNYMMDVSGTVTFNRSLHSQTQNHPLASAFRSSIDWHYLGASKSALVRLTPLLPMITWYNARIMDNYLSKVLDERYADWHSGSASSHSFKSALDLILAGYVAEHKGKNPVTLDNEFKKRAIPQLRTMFFVGHDSTAATICYIFYMLSQNSAALDTLRHEHDEIFGADPSLAVSLLRKTPQLLNKLSYTTAVIKEVLRLFPPASGFRYGRRGTDLINDGHRYPTEDTGVWVLHSALHRNPKYWKDPTAFMPERFLVGPEDPLYPIKGAYRPFEHGPRDCIGQTLAMSKLRITLVLLVRKFYIRPAYEEWDRLHGIPQLRTCRFNGERAYQIGQVGAHPADGFPCRVSIR